MAGEVNKSPHSICLQLLMKLDTSFLKLVSGTALHHSHRQGGDWFGSTLVGRIFFVWFGLAKKVWLFGCSLVEVLQYKCAYISLKPGTNWPNIWS